MAVTAVVLAALAILLAWPVPIALARASWPSRAPGTALVLWQAIAIAGGLSMVGAPLVLGLSPFGDDLVLAVEGLAGRLVDGDAATVPWWSWGCLALAVLLAAYLVAHLVVTAARVERQRRRHLHLVDLLSRQGETGQRILDESAPVAYCLPRGFGSATVLSRGLVELLEPEELQAVIAHERAHVEQRHDVVLVGFRAWHRALPGFPVAELAAQRVAAAIEMLADDRARQAAGDRTLARAIARVATAPRTGAGSGGGAAVALVTPPPGSVPGERVRRLTDEAPRLGLAARATVVLGAVALVALPTAWLGVPVIAAFAR